MAQSSDHGIGLECIHSFHEISKSSHELFIHDPFQSSHGLSSHPTHELYSHPMNIHPSAGADPGFLKGGGSILGLQAKKKGGGPRGGPKLKSLHRGPKGGVRTPWTPWIRYCIMQSSHGHDRTFIHPMNFQLIRPNSQLMNFSSIHG